MLRLIKICFLLGLGAQLGTANFVVVNSASGESNRPIWVFRVFKDGDILNYPRPSISGAAKTQWQSNVMSRYDSGFVKTAYISFVHTLSAGDTQVDFVNSTQACHLGDTTACNGAGYSEAQILAHNSGAWGASVECLADGVTKSASARQMVDDANYVKIIEGPILDIIHVRDDSTWTYNFGWQWDGSTMTNTATTQYQSIYPHFYLFMFKGYAGTMITYVMENTLLGRRQDQHCAIAMKSDASLSTTEFSTPDTAYVATTSITNAGATTTVNFGSAHGRTTGDIISLADGGAGSGSVARGNWKVTVVDADTFTIRTTLGSGGPLTMRPFNFAWGTRIAKTFWSADGSEPGPIRIDYNIDYIIDSKAIPNYNPAYAASLNVSGFDASDQGEIGGKAQTDKGWNGQEESFPVQSIPLSALFHMNDDNYERILWGKGVSGLLGGGGHFTAVLSAPVHFREDSTGSFRDANKDGTADTGQRVGKVLSIDARTTARTSNHSGIPAAVGTMTANGWVVDPEHPHFDAYTAYMISGHPLFAEEVALWAGWYTAMNNPGKALNTRFGVWGLAYSSATRGIGIGIKYLAQAAFILPDYMSDEREYFKQKLEYNIAFREGTYDIRTTANFPPGGTGSSGCTINATGTGCSSGTYNISTETYPWMAGRMTQGQAKQNPLMWISPGTFPNHSTYMESGYRGDAPWHEARVIWAFAVAKELGFDTEALLEALSYNVISKALDPDYNIWLLDLEYLPQCNGADYFVCVPITTWTEAKSAVTATHENKNSWDPSWCGSGPFGYCYAQRAILSYMRSYTHGSLSGAAAWEAVANPSTGIINLATNAPTSNVSIIEPRALSSYSVIPTGMIQVVGSVQ